MSDEGFFRRWARLKSSSPVEEEPAVAPRPVQDVAVASPVPAPATRDGQADAAPRVLPTLEDAEQLTPEADFSAFVAKGVDKSVHRLALKKLFADPHFKVMDGLDIYMSDYNKASPLTPAMLASLQHAQGLVARLLDDQRKDAEEQAALANGEAPPTTEQGTA